MVFVCQIIQRPTAENKQGLATLSKNVAATMTELIQAAEAIKGQSPTLISIVTVAVFLTVVFG